MPDDKLPIPQFAAKIKAKYPEYKDMNDTLLVQKIVSKYPEYESQVDLSGVNGEVKKKENSALSAISKVFNSPSNGSASGNNLPSMPTDKVVGVTKTGVDKNGFTTVAIDQPPQTKNEQLFDKISSEYNWVMNPTVDEEIHPNDPVKNVLNSVKKNIDFSYLPKQSTIDQTAIKSPQQKLPVNTIGNKKKAIETAKAVDDYAATKEYLKNNLFPNINAVKQYVANAPDKNTETYGLMKQKVQEYDNTVQNVESSPNLEIYAINNYRKQNPQFDELVKKAEAQFPNQDQTMIDYRKILGDAMVGRIVASQVLADPNIKQYIESGTPNKYGGEKNLYQDEYNNLKDNILTEYPEFGANVVANKISKERQKRGLNSKFANFNTQAFNDNTDKIAEEILSPQEKQIYDAQIKDNKKKYIDVPGFLNRASEGINSGLSGIKSTFSNTSTLENIRNEMDKQSHQVSAGEQGWYKTLGDMGHMTGFVAEMAAGGSLLKGLGIPAAVADKAMVISNFLGENLNQGHIKYPNDNVKALISGLSNTAAFAALPDIFPAGKVSKALSGIKREIGQAIDDLGDAAVTKQAVRDAAETGFKKWLQGATDFSVQHGKSVMEMLALTKFNQILDKGLGMSDEAYKQYHPESEDEDVVKSMAVANIIPSVVAGYGEYAKRNFTKNAIWDAANNPNRFTNVIESQALPPDVANMLSDKIKFLSETKNILDDNDIPEAQQKTYLLHAANEKALTQQVQDISQKAASIEDPVLRQKELDKLPELQKHIEESQAIKDKILKGEEVKNPDKIPQDEVTPENPVKEGEEKVSMDMGRDELLKKAADIAQQEGVITGFTGDAMRDAAQNNPKEFETYLSEIAQQSQDPNSRETTIRTYGQELVDVAEKLFPKDGISDAEYNDFIDKGKVTPERLNDIANKVKNQESLSDREKEIFTDKTSEVNKIIAESKGQPEEISQPIELSPELPEGYKLPEQAEQPEESKPTVSDSRGGDVEAKIADIEARRQEELKTIPDLQPLSFEKNYEEKKLRWDKRDELTKQINDKYDAELSNIKREQTQNETTQASNKGNESKPAEKVSPSTGEPNQDSQATGGKRGITHEATAETTRKAGLPDYEGHEPVTHEERIAKAKKDIADNPNLADEIMTKVEKGGNLTPQDNAVLAVYKAALDAQLDANPSKEIYDRISRIAKVLNPEGTYAGQLLESRKLVDFNEDNLSNFLMGKEAAQGTSLTDKQVKDETAKFVELKKAKEALAELEAKDKEAYNKLVAEIGVNKAKAAARKASKKTREEHIQDRKAIIEAARADLKKIREQGLKSTIPGLQELKALAPHVKNFMQDLLNEGIDKLDNIVTAIHAEFKDVLDGVRKSDIIDILAGDYDEKKGQTRNEKANQLRLIKREAQLLQELAKEKKGLESEKTENKKTEYNRRIDELTEKIKEVRRINKENEEPEPVEDISVLNEQKAKKEIERLTAKAKKLADDIRNKKYLEEPKKPIPPPRSRKAQLLQDRVIDLENKIRHERSKDEYNKRSKARKAFDKVMEILGLRRLVQSAVDMSVSFRQGATLLSPRQIDVWGKAFKANLKSIFNPKKFERIMYSIRHDPDYHDMVKDRIVFNDLGSADPNLHNEDFRKSFIYDIPLISEPLKASNRSADAFLNVARYEMYKKMRNRMEQQGLTRESDPEAFKKMGNWVMNMTGRGRMTNALENPTANTVMGNTFYGARLMASRFNLLNPKTYLDSRIPKEVRYAAMKDMASFTVTVMASGLALAAAGGKVSLNPDDSDFLQVRFGNKVYDISGGLANYVRTFMRIAKAGYTKATGTKYEGAQATDNAAKSVLNFFRNKLSPNTSYATNAFFGAPYGQKFDPYDIIKIYPMYGDDVVKALKEEGVMAIPTVLLPNILGVGYGSYASKGQIDANLEDLLKRNLRSDEMNNEKIYNYKEGGRPITDKEFNEFADKRDAEIEKDIKVLFETGVGGTKYKDLTPEQVRSETSYIKSKATESVKEEMFGKQHKSREEKKSDSELKKEREKKYQHN